MQHVGHSRENFIRAQHIAVRWIALNRPLGWIIKFYLEEFAVLTRALTEEFIELGEFVSELAIDLVATDA